MAEGLVNHFLGDGYEAFSAGTDATFVNPRAITVMKEIGIDISGHRSKNLDSFAQRNFDYVITLCGDAHEKCPLFFGGVRLIHLGFADPAVVCGTEEEIMSVFRGVRDEMKEAIIAMLSRK